LGVPVEQVTQQDLFRLNLLARFGSLIRREDYPDGSDIVDVQRLRPRPVKARVLASPCLGLAAALVSPPLGQPGAQLHPVQRWGSRSLPLPFSRLRSLLPATTRSGLAGVIQSKPRCSQAARVCLASKAVSPSTRTRLPLGTRTRRIICAAMSAWV